MVSNAWKMTIEVILRDMRERWRLPLILSDQGPIKRESIRTKARYVALVWDDMVTIQHLAGVLIPQSVIKSIIIRVAGHCSLGDRVDTPVIDFAILSAIVCHASAGHVVKD